MSRSHRRDMLLAMGSAVALPTVLTDRLLALGAADHVDRIGIQLYTLRHALDADFAGTLERLAAIGYKEVEFAWNRGTSPTGTRKVLRAAGLTARSAHLGVADFESEWWRPASEFRG